MRRASPKRAMSTRAARTHLLNPDLPHLIPAVRTHSRYGELDAWLPGICIQESKVELILAGLGACRDSDPAVEQIVTGEP